MESGRKSGGGRTVSPFTILLLVWCGSPAQTSEVLENTIDEDEVSFELQSRSGCPAIGNFSRNWYWSRPRAINEEKKAEQEEISTILKHTRNSELIKKVAFL